jgi:hypothetical protein
MKNCLLCESTSTASNGDMDNDIYWFLFNMKYAAQYCLYDDTTNTPAMPACESACQPLKPVLEWHWFGSDGKPSANQYGYCNLSGGAFGQYVEGCSSCLQGVKGSVVLGNCTFFFMYVEGGEKTLLTLDDIVLETMQEGCKAKPRAAQGSTIPLQRQLFNTSTFAPSTSASPTSTSTPAPVSSSSSAGSSGLSTGAAAGIGVGIGIVALLVLGALVWFLLRRRRRASPSERVEEMKDPLPPQYYRHQQQHMPPQQLDGTPVAEADGDPTKLWRAELPGR